MVKLSFKYKEKIPLNKSKKTPLAYHYSVPHGGNVDNVETEINKKLKELSKDDLLTDYRVQCQVSYGGELRGSKPIDTKNSRGWANIKDGINLFRYGEESEIPENFQYYEDNIRTVIMYLIHKSYVGGLDKYNDCLFKALEYGVGSDRKKLPESIRSPILLKKFLKIDRLAKVDVKDIQKIENEMKDYYINITGDYTYISKFQDRKLGLNIELDNGHYKLKHVKNSFFYDHEFSIKPKENVYSYEYDGDVVNIYNGSKSQISQKELEKLMHSDDYIFLKVTSDNLEITREKFIDKADKLFEETKGFINLYKYCWVNEMFKDTFRKFNFNLTEPDKIEQLESRFIDDGYTGGLVYGLNGYNGYGIEYDGNSWYPSCLIDRNFNFPVKKGQFMYISDKEFSELKYFKYGIYRCLIKFDSDKMKLFRFSKRNHYTHYDLTRARELGLEMHIIEDNESNFLYYSTNCLVKGHKLFQKYIEYFFDLKSRGFDGAKDFLNCFIGGLSQKCKYSKFIRDGSKLKLLNEDKIDNITRSEGMWKFEFHDSKKLFKNNFGRISAFITSFSRMKISRVMEQYENKIVRVHTDGFICNEKIDIPIGLDMGQFKIKQEGTINIKNVNSFVFSEIS